jgi:choline-sulfatase
MKYAPILAALLLAPLAVLRAAEAPNPFTPSKPNPPQRVNILVIMSDEHNASVMGCAGDRLARTPHLDALAARGVIFGAHYCSSPICIPSRQSFTTGKYVSRHNVWGNTPGVPEGTPSLPRLLNAAGYESFLDGKMHYKGGLTHGFRLIDEKTGVIRTAHNGEPDSDRNQEEKSEPPTAKKVKPRHRLPAGEFRDNGMELGEEFAPIGIDENMDSFIDVARRNNAIKFLRERQLGDKPFFLVVGFITPHYPLVAPREYIAHFKDKIPMPEIPLGYLDALPLNYKHLRNYRKLERVPPETVKLARESYYARVEWTDHQIGLVLDALKASPFADNTIVIYTSDHGENMGEHGLWWKNCMYDTAARVPLIISWPARWKGGQQRSGACGAVDLVQTILELGGVKPPTDWNGNSLVPWLDGPSFAWKNLAVSEYYSGYIASGMVMIRRGDWKYVYHTRADEKHGPQRELYQLSADPKELRNLAGDPQQQARLLAMHAALVRELGEDPEQTEARWRAGVTPEAPQGVVANGTKQSVKDKGDKR